MPVRWSAPGLLRRRRRPSRATLVSLLTALVVLLGIAPTTRAQADAATQLTLVSLPRAPATAVAGAVNVPMLALTVSLSAGNEVLSDLRIVRTGTAADSDVRDQGVQVWWDANGNGVVDGLDKQLDSGTFRDGAVWLSADQPVHWILPVQLIVTLELRPDATAGATIGVMIADASGVTALGESLVAGVFPLASSLTAIVAPPSQQVVVEVSGNVSQASGVTIVSADGKVRATIPAGAAPMEITVTLVNVAPAGLPERPGLPAGDIYRVEWVAAAGETPPVLSSPVRIELDLAALLAEGIRADDLRILALGADGVWRTLPSSLSADGGLVILSVSVQVTFSLVVLHGAAADLLPPSGGAVTAPDGSARATLPADAVSTPLLISLTPSTAPPPALSGSSQAVGAAIVFQQQDPVTGQPAHLAGPVTVALATPDTSGIPGCEAGCDVVAYGVPADGGVPVPLPTRNGPNGLEVLVEVTVNVTIVLVAGPDVAAGRVPAGEAGSVATGDGRTRVVAPVGPATLDVTIAPVSAVAANASAVSDDLAGRPVHVAYAADGAPGASQRPTVVEIVLASLDAAVDPARLQAFGSPAGSDEAPRRLPSVVDQAAGVIRIALETSMTIYIVDDASGAARAVPLASGWNLVTYSGPDGTPVEFVSQALGGRVEAIHRWNAASAHYESYLPRLPQSPTLAQVNGEDVLWIFVSGDAVAWGLPATPPPPRGIVLYPGWNLVSWSGPAVGAADLLAAIRSRVASAFVWVERTREFAPVVLVVGPPLPLTIATRDAIWILINDVTPLIWDQPGVRAG